MENRSQQDKLRIDVIPEYDDREELLKGTAMQIEKGLINDRLLVSKVSWKYCILTIYNSAVIYPWNLLLS